LKRYIGFNFKHPSLDNPLLSMMTEDTKVCSKRIIIYINVTAGS
jgi:hypothetical protein